MIYLIGKLISLDGRSNEIGYCESAEEASEYCKKQPDEEDYFIVELEKLS